MSYFRQNQRLDLDCTLSLGQRTTILTIIHTCYYTVSLPLPASPFESILAIISTDSGVVSLGCYPCLPHYQAG